MLDRVFGNRYRLVEKIGVGGMAEVYKATDEVLGRTVAVKVMLPQYASDPSFAARFKQEAQSAANLQSPYIVNIYDWGQDSLDGTYYIVMEYVRGTDLKTAITQRGAINQRKVAEIGSQVCAALSVAHGYDIIHRDIKPHNIMVQPDGNSKVMDFGIARASGSSMTQTGSVLGTAYYISPEQAQGRPLTAATDLYSLGVVLYEAVTGQVPFDAPDAVAVALKQVNDYPIPPSHLNPKIDPELEVVIMRALEKEPADRYLTAEQMRVALNNFLAGRPVDTNVDAPAAKTRVMSAHGAPTMAAGGAFGGAIGGSGLPVMGQDGSQISHTAVMPQVLPPNGGMNMRSSQRAKEEAARKKRKRMIIIAVIASILSVVVIAGAIWALTSNQPSKIEVPDVIGMTEAQAKSEFTDLGLESGDIKREASADVEEGKVISTDPSAKTMVDKGTKINMVISSGPEPPKKVKVPNLRDKTPTEARQLLIGLNLVYEKGEDRFDETIEAGKICAQEIAADTEVDEGTIVIVYASKGKDTVSVPSILGKTIAEADAILVAQGLVLGTQTEAHDETVPVGCIISQDPTISASVARGSAVSVVVSLGPEPISVPNVVGMSEEAAIGELEELGFEVKVGGTEYSDNVRKGCVIRYSPEGKQPKGTTITLIISDGVEIPEPDPGTGGGGSGTGSGSGTSDGIKND